MASVRAGGCAASAYGVCPRWRLCRFRLWRLSALARRCVLLFSWDRELYAGAAFVPAGCSSGTGVCARGGWSAGRCGAVGRSCVRSCLLLRFCRRVLHSLTPAMRQRAAFCALLTAGRLLTPRFVLFHACHTVLLECLALVHACLFSFIRKKRDGLRYVSFLFRVVGIAICRFSCLLMVIGLRWFTSGLRVSLWRFRQGTRGTGSYGVGGAA